LYQTSCWPVVGDHQRSPSKGDTGGTGEMVMIGVRVMSCGVTAGGKVAGSSTVTWPAVNGGVSGSVCTHEPSPLVGLRYQTYSWPEKVLNHRSPSAGPGGGVGELMTVRGTFSSGGTATGVPEALPDG
jgi:hypothetical protein